MVKQLYISALFCLIAMNSEAVNYWTQRADFGSHGRHRGTAISIRNKGYMGLGHYNGAGPNIVLKDWWQYDPATNSWAQKADYIGNNGNGSYGVLSLGIGDYGYVGGGSLASDGRFWRYDPSSNSWSEVATCPTTPVNVEGFVIDDKAYYLTGSSVYEYDATLDVWTTKNQAPFSVSSWHSAFAIEGKGYVKVSSSFWEYKPTTDAWAPRAPYPGQATGGSVAFVQHKKGYITCGYSGWLSDVVREVWQYDPATNQWDSITEFPGTSRRFSSGFSIGNRSYFGIGTNGTNFNDFWEFNANAGLGIQQLSPNDVKIFPNPAVESFNINIETLPNFELKLYDLLGNIVASSHCTNGALKLNRNGLSSGTYIFHVLSDGNMLYSDQIIFN